MDIAAERLYPTPYANSAILSLLLLSLTSQKHVPKTTSTVHTEYDYIIVGGGTSGSVVASRLSELPCVNVLLLEAGKDPPLLTEIPALSKFFRRTDIDWNYKTVPQKHTGESLVNKEIPLVRGKTLGGSSVLKSIMSTRGSRQDYNRWASKGAQGWSYDEVMPYFYKLEDNKDPEYIKNGFHSVGGLQTIQRPRYQPETKKPIFQAARNIGFKVVDPNALKQTGFYDFQATLREGQRCSTAKSYLVPAENRTNLHILSNAMVTNIIIEDGGATGVKYDFQGETYEIRARKEVIMSAGAINTAQILMLSGIGPKKELEKFKIPVLADLPVGENLQDHCAVPLNFEMNSSIPGVLQKLMNPANVELYTKNKTGALASPEFITALGFVNSDDNEAEKDTPSYQLRIYEEASIFSEIYYGLKSEIYSHVFEKYEKKSYFTCLSQTLRPRSRGAVRLRSRNPYDPPLIDPNYLENPKDVNDIVEGLKTCKKLALNSAMQKLNSVEFQRLYPACKEYKSKEELYFWCLSKQVVISMNNPVGTAKMGNPGDPTTVVDAELRVKYIRGLRVVDASIMPSIISGDTSIPTIMIAEKASDIIKSSIDCEDSVAESEVQESVPMITLSTDYLPQLLKKSSQRRMHTNSALDQLKQALGLNKVTRVKQQRSSPNRIESQIVELVKAIQETTLNRRQEDPSNAAAMEVVKCLEVLRQQISNSGPRGTSSSVAYLTNGGSSESLTNQLALVLNNLQLNGNSQNNGRNVLSNNRVATALTNLLVSLESLNQDREVSETTSSSSLASSGNGASATDTVNQLMSALNNLRDEGRSQIATDLGRESNRNSQSTQLNQLLSSIGGNRQGNGGSNPNNLLNQILTATSGNAQGNDGSDQNALLNQLLSATRGATQGNEQSTLLNQILSATRGNRQGNDGNDQNSLLNQILSAARENGQGNVGSDQNALLSQILSSASGTGPINVGNDQNDLIRQILSAARDNGQGNNGNDQNGLLNQILSASRGIEQGNNGNAQNTLINQILSAAQGTGQENAGSDPNALLNQILSATRDTGQDNIGSDQNALLNQILSAARGNGQENTGSDPNALLNQILSATRGTGQDNTGSDQNALLNQILSSARGAGQGNTGSDSNALLNQILSASRGIGQGNSGSDPNTLLNQMLSATASGTGQESTGSDQNALLNQILSAARGTGQVNTGSDQNALLNQILSATRGTGQGNVVSDPNALLNQALSSVGGNAQSSNSSDQTALLNQILSAARGSGQGSSGRDQTALLNQILSAASGTGQVNNGRGQNLPEVQGTGQNTQSPQINSNSNTNNTSGATQDTVQDLMNRIMSSINDIRQIEEESRELQNRSNSVPENVDATQSMMNQILSAINDLRNSSRQSQDETTTTPSSPENAQETVLNQILSTLNEIRQSNQQPRQTQPVTNSTTENSGNSNDSALNQILLAINEMRDGMQTARQSNIINSDNSFQRGEMVVLQDANNNNRGVQQLLNQQGIPPLFQTIIRQEVGGSDSQANRANQFLPTANGMAIGPAGVPLVPAGMPFVPPGMQPFVPPGAPLMPPGMLPNPLLNLIQRQRNLQMLSALNGGGFNPQAPLPPQLIGMPQRIPVPVPPVLNPLSGMPTNQPPCHKTIILNNLNACNPNMSQKPMTPSEVELCQSLQSGTQCQNASKCKAVPPYLYKHYCGNQ